MNQRPDNRDPEAILSERLGDVGVVSTALRERAATLAQKFDAQPKRRSNWKLIAVCAGVAVFGLMFVSTKASAQFSALIWRGISLRGGWGPKNQTMPTLAELMKNVKDRDRQFLNYSYEGKTTMHNLMPADPPALAAARPAGERSKYSKAHWQTDVTEVRTWTIRDVWRYQGTGRMTMSYSSDDDEPMVDNNLVTFSRFPSGGTAETNMQVIATRHPVLGLGLGGLKDVTISRSGDHLILTGRDPLTASKQDPSSGTRVTATFADLQGTQLQSIVRQDGKKGSFIQSYLFSDYVAFGAATVPTKISYSFTLGGKQQDLITYEVRNVDTSLRAMPPAEPWFKPGHQFIDERVTPPVQFEYRELLKLNGGSTVLDSKKLLEFSKAKALAAANKAVPSQPTDGPPHG